MVGSKWFYFAENTPQKVIKVEVGDQWKMQPPQDGSLRQKPEQKRDMEEVAELRARLLALENR